MDPVSTIQLVASAAVVSRNLSQWASKWVSESHRSLERQIYGASSGKLEYGLDVINENGREHDVDICFVHGLKGDRRRTWTLDGDNASGFWPGELLVDEPGVRRARILTYGYDSDSPSPEYLTERTLYHQSQELLSELSRVRRDDCDRRLIFVCHTLGGVLVQSALVIALASKDEILRRIHHSVRGLIFLNTPYSGRMPDEEWSNSFIRLVHITEPDMEELERSSKKLKIMLEPFVAASSEIHIEELTAFRTGGSIRLRVYDNSRGLQIDPEMTREDYDLLGHVMGKEDLNYQLLARNIANICRNSRRPHVRKLGSQGSLIQDTLPKAGVRFFTLPPDLPCRTHHHTNPRGDIDDVSRRWTKATRELGQIVCLHGSAGTGKTQLALAYAHRRAEEFTSVYWIPAENKQAMRLGFYGIGSRLLEHYSSILLENSSISKQSARLTAAEMLGLREVVHGHNVSLSPPTFQASRIVTEAVRDWFNRADNTKWLLILDGMDSPDLNDCLSLLPMQRKNGVVLITRCEAWSPPPSMRTRVVVEHILRLPTTGPDDLHADPGYVLDHGDFSEQEGEFGVRLDELSETEHTLLACCSLFPGEFIPIRFFSVNCQTLDILDAEHSDIHDAIGNALSGLSGLITVREDFEDVFAEARRAAKLRNKLDPGVLRTVEKVAWRCMSSFAFDLSKSSFSVAVTSLNQKRLVDMISSYTIKHGIASLQTLSTYEYLKLATLCLHRGYQNTAERVTDYARQRLSKPELRTEVSVRLLEMYVDLKNTTKAEALFERVHTPATRSATRSVRASFQKVEARLKELNGKADEAITLLRKAMMNLDAEDGDDPSQNVTMWPLEDLVNCLIRKHNYEMAQPLLRRQLLTFERIYGFNSPAAVGILEKLISVFLAQGRLEDAQDALERVHKSNKARLGVDHPKTQACALELAAILDQRGHYEQASKLYDCALELNERWRGPADPNSLIVRIRRAECFEARQMHDDAISDYRTALEACEKAAGLERRRHNEELKELKGMVMRYLVTPNEIIDV